MLNKQTQKNLLKKIKSIYNDFSKILDDKSIIQFKQIKDELQKELSVERSSFYNEIIDGIILALNQLPQTTDKSEQEQILILTKDLISHVFNELLLEKTKVDMVFLPYKASMWDSLESIWSAAYEDKEHCNAYVVPIPYADRKPDQTVAKWNYEADQFPKYVPILDWQKINLAEMHPDAIFIHNPYDNCNGLTSVGSEYYSDELKKYTDKLIYVPYTVLTDTKPGNFEAEEKLAHYITAPAILNADLVFVQSEDMRQVYINVLMRHTDQKNRKYWEQHILGLGSPKYDKFTLIKKENLNIPKKWLKIIKKPDNSWKKIVLYNTGLNPMLTWEDKMIDKIEIIMEIFKQNKDDIALLWRPHPLIDAAMVGILPELRKKYELIVQKYKTENWGIYDDTADLDRAIILSDAYYGDGSSVLRLYEFTGKPILINNPLFKNYFSQTND